MSPLDVSVVVRKLALIEERLDLLVPIARLAIADYRADMVRKKGAEKLLQELINAAVDVNYHLLVQTGTHPPADAFESFLELARQGALDADLARVLAPSAGLRNRLVHNYATLDDAKVHAALGEAQRRYPEYVAAIRARFVTRAETGQRE